MSHIAVVGLGKMGAALAGTFMGAGKSVTVWNRSADKAAPLVRNGAHLAPSLENLIAENDVIVCCVKNHATAHDMLAPHAALLPGKTVIDLSTGAAAEAESLVSMLVDAGAKWHIGMINAYPSGVGDRDTAILCAGPVEVWESVEGLIRILGGASSHVGTTASSVPGLFAAMFTARQGMMFGLIYGGVVCKKAGLPLTSFARQIPVTVGVAQKYAERFIETVPEGKYDDAAATMEVYLDALEDVMDTFETTGTPDALPRLMRDLTQQAVDEGLKDKELTALVELLAKG